ncbi:MAG: methyl-accepting chemotaxis protein, partial [Zetaproteobacteria bacterium]|nr:methyl-accepting chemotaxis protein [Zetaproteobacteria bacterium]
KGGNLKEVLTKYTQIVHGLMDTQKSTALFSSSTISGKIRSFLLIESARENAGLLRANLSSILAANLPLSDAQFQKINSFKSGLDSNLNSQGLDLSPSQQNFIQRALQKSHWLKVEEVFKTVITLSNEGGFDEDASEFFKTITKVVDDVGSFIEMDLAEIKRITDEEKKSAIHNLMMHSLEVGFNIILVLLVLIFSLRNIRVQMSDSIQKIVDSTSHVSNASIELSKTSHNLSSGSQQTAAALQETVSSMTEMNSMVSRTLDKSKEAKSSSEDIGSKANRAQEAVNNMVVAMEQLAESNEQLEQVNKIIRSIAKQTKVIDDIVFKTQLLAVNASIEAAKAGVHGKGFAVVAGEVSKLAQVSGEASEHINILLDESEEKVNKITHDVDNRISQGSSSAKSVKSVFNEINKSVIEIQGFSDDMTNACEEQSLGIDQVSEAVSQIDQASQHNTTEAQMIERQSTNLREESRELKRISAELRHQILGFGNDTQEKNIDHSSSSSTSEYPKEFTTHESDPALPDQEGHVVGEDIADDDSFRPV